MSRADSLYEQFRQSPELCRVEELNPGMRVTLIAPLDFEGFVLPAGTVLHWAGDLHPAEFQGTALAGTLAQGREIQEASPFCVNISGYYWSFTVSEAFEVGRVSVPAGSRVEWVFYGWENTPRDAAMVHEVRFPAGRIHLGKYACVKFDRKGTCRALQASESVTAEGVHVPKGFWLTLQVDATGPSDPMMRHYDGSSAAD